MIAKFYPVCGIAWVFLMGTMPIVAQVETVDYQDRGDRFEGRRSHPVGGTEIELLGATIDGPAPLLSLPEDLSLKFYLQEAADAYVVVRERETQKEYWLDQVRRSKPWLARTVNQFSWSSAVLKELRLEPNRLTALVRLGYSSPRLSERVAPAQLGSVQTPLLVDAFRFTFRTSRPADLSVRLEACPGRVEPARTKTGRRIPFDVVVRVDAKAAGSRCHLQLAGEMADDAAPIIQGVDFIVPASATK